MQSFISSSPPLPIEQVLDELKVALRDRNEAVLQAPPGAGKTTLVPLALAGEQWLAHRKIIMLEPRRIAARNAAYRMASLLQERVGQTIGYRMRLETVVSNYTKIEVITEGILTRMLQEDPSLQDVGLIIFDEFHERNLDSDVALSLSIKSRSMFRETDPLKLLVMSATLDAGSISLLLGHAPVITSEGRQFPVDIQFGRASQPRERIVDRVVAQVKAALAANSESSILVFLPGQGEIIRARDALDRQLLDSAVDVRALYGNLPIEAQQAAINPCVPGNRKVVLATNIAETSLTIEGVDIVIDSGLERVPLLDANSGMTRLETRRISKASAIQRAGRAGRLKPGTCYRLWSKDQQQQMAEQAEPQILNADLAPTLLQLFRWGLSDPSELDWLDLPPAGHWQAAITLLSNLGAISGKILTPHGEKMSNLSVHPRLAHMLIKGAVYRQAETAAYIAAVLSDRDPFPPDDPDMSHRLAILQGEESCPGHLRGWFHRTHQLAGQFSNQLFELDISSASQATLNKTNTPGFLIACAFPDRIARQRHSGGYQLSSGSSASLPPHSLGKSKWLAVAETGGAARSKGDNVRSAASLDETIFATHLADLVHSKTVVEWDKKNGRFVAESRRCIGELILEKRKLDKVPVDEKIQAILAHVAETRLSILNWTPEAQQLRARVNLIRLHRADWPDFSDAGLLASLDDWLTPYIGDITLLSDFRKLKVTKMLEGVLGYAKQQELNQLTPAGIKVPSGSSHTIDYTSMPPVLAVKLQEMFGLEDTPSILLGEVQLVIHLLSPAGRPLQVTQDLGHFWRNTYKEVKKDMKGRYPKHPWPDDPLTATPTRHTKQHAKLHTNPKNQV